MHARLSQFFPGHGVRCHLSEHQWHTMFSLATSHFPTLPYRLITRCSRHLSRIPLWSISLVVDLRLLDLSGSAVSFCLIRSPRWCSVSFRLCPLSAASLPFLRPPASSSLFSPALSPCGCCPHFPLWNLGFPCRFLIPFLLRSTGKTYVTNQNNYPSIVVSTATYQNVRVSHHAPRT